MFKCNQVWSIENSEKYFAHFLLKMQELQVIKHNKKQRKHILSLMPTNID